MASDPIIAWQIEGGKVETVTCFLFFASKITADSDCSHEIRRQLLLGRKAMTNLDNVLKSRDITLPTKVHIIKAKVFPVVTYAFENWTVRSRMPKNGCLWTVVLKTPESSLDSKEIKPVNFMEDQPWIITGRTDDEAEIPVFWSSVVNRWVIGKVPDAGKDWGQKEKRSSEDEVDGQPRWCNEHVLEQTLGDGKRQGGQVCYSPWSPKESDSTGWLNNNKITNEAFKNQWEINVVLFFWNNFGKIG